MMMKGSLEKLNPQNLIMQEIYDFLIKPSLFDLDKLRLILTITELFLEDRNLATNKKIYSKDDVRKILKKLIPLINELIVYLIKI